MLEVPQTTKVAGFDKGKVVDEVVAMRQTT